MVVLSQLALDQFIKHCKTINKNKGSNNNLLLPPSGIIPTIDLTHPDANSLLVNACKEYGFFKVVNHGIPLHDMTQLEVETRKFFNLPQSNKESAGTPSPFGYGNKNIGQNGDVGWVEYLLLSSSPDFISKICHSVFRDNPHVFRHSLLDYITKVREIAVQILEMMEEGLKIEKNALSKLIKDEKSDSYFRLNHYPPKPESLEALIGKNLVGFGEHTDPQIISLLRSNNIGGLQISLKDGSWVSVPPDDHSLFILVGDSLQVMTNGRFKSVKHRVLADNRKSRLSMIFFAGPPLNEKITPLPCIMQNGEESLYEEFTWWEYKKSAYNSRLSDNRLSRFLNKNRTTN